VLPPPNSAALSVAAAVVLPIPISPRHTRSAEGETASSHLAGLTLDIQRRGMSKEQIRFVQRYLFYLTALGLVEPEEERRQWVFHVMVSERYAGWRHSQDVVQWDSVPFEELSQK